MTRMRFTLAVLLLLGAGPATAQTSIAGDWQLTIQSPQGTNSVLVTFKQDGENISGLFKSPMGELPFQGGTLTGNDLKFSFTIPVQGQPIEITMTGKVEGASIAGKAQFGGFAEGDWGATRVEAAGTAPAAAAAPAAPAAPAPAAPDAPAAPAAAAPAAPATPAPATGASTGLNGKWDLTLKTQMGDVPVTAEFQESAGQVTGSIIGPMGPVDVSGTFDGNALKLEFTAKTPQGDIPVSMSGEFNGDSIVNGKAEFGGMGQGEWTAKRTRP